MSKNTPPYIDEPSRSSVENMAETSVKKRRNLLRSVLFGVSVLMAGCAGNIPKPLSAADEKAEVQSMVLNLLDAKEEGIQRGGNSAITCASGKDKAGATKDASELNRDLLDINNPKSAKDQVESLPTDTETIVCVKTTKTKPKKSLPANADEAKKRLLAEFGVTEEGEHGKALIITGEGDSEASALKKAMSFVPEDYHVSGGNSASRAKDGTWVAILRAMPGKEAQKLTVSSEIKKPRLSNKEKTATQQADYNFIKQRLGALKLAYNMMLREWRLKHGPYSQAPGGKPEIRFKIGSNGRIKALVVDNLSKKLQKTRLMHHIKSLLSNWNFNPGEAREIIFPVNFKAPAPIKKRKLGLSRRRKRKPKRNR